MKPKMKEIDRPYYYGASPEILKRAEILRKNLTIAEATLWERLNKSQLDGLRFKAQHPIDRFIVDFYCHKALLVIEIDGEIHAHSEVDERDEGREYEIKKLGLSVLRFRNGEVLSNLDKVVLSIKEYINRNK